jgi:hypothetical protein
VLIQKTAKKNRMDRFYNLILKKIHSRNMFQLDTAVEMCHQNNNILQGTMSTSFGLPGQKIRSGMLTSRQHLICYKNIQQGISNKKIDPLQNTNQIHIHFYSKADRGMDKQSHEGMEYNKEKLQMICSLAYTA